MVLAPFLALIVGEKLLAIRSTATLASTNSCYGSQSHPIPSQHDVPVLLLASVKSSPARMQVHYTLCTSAISLGLHRSLSQPQFKCFLRYCGAKVFRTNSATTRNLAPIRFLPWLISPFCNGILALPPPLSCHLNRSHHHNPRPTVSSSHSLSVI